MRFIRCLLFLLLLLPCTLGAQSFTGQVVSVEKGDVLRIQRDTGIVTVELYGIDTPELKQPYGREALHYVTDAVLRKTVRVFVRNADGNLLSGRVERVDGTSLNALLLRQGLAWWHNREAPDAVHLQTIEREAQKANRRIWSQYHPVAPWEWRAARSSTP